jgi:hypothetical protein
MLKLRSVHSTSSPDPLNVIRARQIHAFGVSVYPSSLRSCHAINANYCYFWRPFVVCFFLNDFSPQTFLSCSLCRLIAMNSADLLLLMSLVPSPSVPILQFQPHFRRSWRELWRSSWDGGYVWPLNNSDDDARYQNAMPESRRALSLFELCRRPPLVDTI